ncbi:MAG: NAD(P)/FAD-dependent oxidoreductase [Gemmatimonadota bacterium]|nr:NAD(P)/FAD-dependent oxidoreductase [Gemmatimonadota bacterium]MDH3369424.1 NAD(P)/FAD-dependent oxidoreductase [Gemmatimonadota bacterium]MDH3479608.1 NAD(P)/FAD-dependent oxidoreductase [Gemmatimonadota bacterium]MDH3570055.1 NAD(P)/FAD-dependent oxidoreductase [Gemmatimonadota bacterium]MDH5550233.1 NAD(P)/FAD-dependent oxidoreductase [Gemmatimonadota bacterium]
MAGTRCRVAIVGGGFGGLYTAKRLRRAPVDVTLVDRRNFHVFQPLLYQVATGGLSPADITSALRWTLRRLRNTRVWLGEAVDFDLAGQRVRLADGELEYDVLVVATGARHHYFSHDEWEQDAPGLKTIEDATEIRSRVLRAFEMAERRPASAKRDGWLTFAVVGGGPTGVELAGAIAELARYSMAKDFRAIDTRGARVLLVEGADRVLPSYPRSLSHRAQRSLERLGVTVSTSTLVTDITGDAITVQRGEESERIPARTVLWAAGIHASPLGRRLADASGAESDRTGRVIVEPDLTVPGHPEVFVIGDLAHFPHQTGEPLPGIAPVAMQQGRYVADTILRRLGGRPVRPFRYFNKGELATIGRAAAVANFGRLRFSGYPAWLLWLFVHLMYLVEFENRILVFFQWAWNYLTWNRGARLIAHGTAADHDGT